MIRYAPDRGSPRTAKLDSILRSDALLVPQAREVVEAGNHVVDPRGVVSASAAEGLKVLNKGERAGGIKSRFF